MSRSGSRSRGVAADSERPRPRRASTDDLSNSDTDSADFSTDMSESSTEREHSNTRERDLERAHDAISSSAIREDARTRQFELAKKPLTSTQGGPAYAPVRDKQDDFLSASDSDGHLSDDGSALPPPAIARTSKPAHRSSSTRSKRDKAMPITQEKETEKDEGFFSKYKWWLVGALIVILVIGVIIGIVVYNKNKDDNKSADDSDMFSANSANSTDTKTGSTLSSSATASSKVNTALPTNELKAMATTSRLALSFSADGLAASDSASDLVHESKATQASASAPSSSSSIQTADSATATLSDGMIHKLATDKTAPTDKIASSEHDASTQTSKVVDHTTTLAATEIQDGKLSAFETSEPDHVSTSLSGAQGSKFDEKKEMTATFDDDFTPFTDKSQAQPTQQRDSKDAPPKTDKAYQTQIAQPSKTVQGDDWVGSIQTVPHATQTRLPGLHQDQQNNSDVRQNPLDKQTDHITATFLPTPIVKTGPAAISSSANSNLSPSNAPGQSAAPPIPSSTNQTTAAGAVNFGLTGVHYQGRATWFESSQHLSACHTVFSDTDMVAALHPDLYGSNGTVSPFCGALIHVMNPVSGNTVDVVIQDNCPLCRRDFSLDLSKTAFSNLGLLDQGVLEVQWWWDDERYASLMPPDLQDGIADPVPAFGAGEPGQAERLAGKPFDEISGQAPSASGERAEPQQQQQEGQEAKTLLVGDGGPSSGGEHDVNDDGRYHEERVQDNDRDASNDGQWHEK
ncbi:hypothetical protein OIV83_005514 [Microbotryomycetes sp. JL201]|nr:hypothetical protein OIV83_005514 [Microbotryomycetes sp. JL201]